MVNFKIKVNTRYFAYFLTTLSYLATYFLYIIYFVISEYLSATKTEYSTIYLLNTFPFWTSIILILSFIAIEQAWTYFNVFIKILGLSKATRDFKHYLKQISFLRVR